AISDCPALPAGCAAAIVGHREWRAGVVAPASAPAREAGMRVVNALRRAVAAAVLSMVGFAATAADYP
ncbi:hypothetical protein, partial [Stenotrophomonas maltophilia]|uniref:hypothetical protein n=1 Tax=Stenotrophomonas maltophilia TaxID=40324 RepID=UPI0019540B8A